MSNNSKQQKGTQINAQTLIIKEYREKNIKIMKERTNEITKPL